MASSGDAIFLCAELEARMTDGAILRRRGEEAGVRRRERRRCAPHRTEGAFAVFIAMNRFQVKPGSEADFEAVWLGRDTYLRDVPGFLSFQLLRGPDREGFKLYASHSLWRSREDFEAWTRSEAFRLAHKDAGDNRGLYAGPPNFEGFDVLQEVEAA
jgi:heme-degrading monooxygenase HmoA